MERLRILDAKLRKMKELGQDKTPKFGKIVTEYWAIRDSLGDMINLNPLTPEQKAKMKVKHFDLHIPAYATKTQLDFIVNTAKAVIANEPITIVHEKAMQFLLKCAYTLRNVYTEFDEQVRWTDGDNEMLEVIAKEFKPILDWLVENYKLNVNKFRRD